jgi:hypothetical protein
MSIQEDPTLINKIHTEACSICNSNASKICIINPTVDENKCKSTCEQKSASTFYYDTNSKRCYCGQTKEDCNQTYANTGTCDVDFSKTCVLKENSTVNDKNIGTITDTNCQYICNNILGATGFYCDDSKQCICIDPKLPPPAPPSDYCINNNNDHLTCSNNKCIPTIDDLKNKVDEKYYKYDLGLNQDQQKAAYCGCDYDILQKYKDILNNNPTVTDITLSTKWKSAITKFNEAGNTKSVHDIFQESLNLNENELRTLMAYEMCRITNDKYPNGRNSVKIVPDISQPKEWLEYYFDSSTMKTVAMILVICMLLQILFRTLFPQDGNIENSLIYAMSIPNDFMAKEKKIGAVTSLIITILLAMLIIYYTNKSSEGEQAIYWFLFITIAIGLALSIKYFTEKDSMPLIAILILIGIFITISLVYNILKKPSSDGIKPDGDTTDVKLYEKVVRIVFYSFGSIGILLSIFLYKNSKNINIIPAIISIAFLFIGGIFSFNNYIKSNGQGLFDFFIPNSWNPKDFFKSGLVYSILLIIIASLGKRFQPYIIPFGLLSLSIVYTIFKKQDDTQNDKNKKIQSKWSSIMGYSWSVTVVSIILSIFGYITKKSDLLVYAITTIFGIIPLSVFFIIINFAIAIYSPIAEIVLLVIWRISGAFAIRKEGKSIGKIILLLFGKKETDKWVLPFLPWISNIIRMYYLISKDNQPDYIKYYNKYTESTGTRNTDMWFS